MNRRLLYAVLLMICCAALASGCASSSGSVHGSVYYGVGWHDPYYGYNGWYGGAVVVPNPPDRPDRPDTLPTDRPRPEQLPAAGVASRPSIPSTPRPSGGGGGRRR